MQQDWQFIDPPPERDRLLDSALDSVSAARADRAIRVFSQQQQETLWYGGRRNGRTIVRDAAGRELPATRSITNGSIAVGSPVIGQRDGQILTINQMPRVLEERREEAPEIGANWYMIHAFSGRIFSTKQVQEPWAEVGSYPNGGSGAFPGGGALEYWFHGSDRFLAIAPRFLSAFGAANPVAFALSFDGGRSWGRGELPSPLNDDGNGIAFLSAAAIGQTILANRFYLNGAGTQQTFEFWRSTEGGVTGSWSLAAQWSAAIGSQQQTSGVPQIKAFGIKDRWIGIAAQDTVTIENQFEQVTRRKISVYSSSDQGVTWVEGQILYNEFTANAFIAPVAATGSAQDFTGVIQIQRIEQDESEVVDEFWVTADGGQTWTIDNTVPLQALDRFNLLLPYYANGFWRSVATEAEGYKIQYSKYGATWRDVGLPTSSELLAIRAIAYAPTANGGQYLVHENVAAARTFSSNNLTTWATISLPTQPATPPADVPGFGGIIAIKDGRA